MKKACKLCPSTDYTYNGYDLCVPCLIHLDINGLDIDKYRNNDKRSWEKKK